MDRAMQACRRSLTSRAACSSESSSPSRIASWTSALELSRCFTAFFSRVRLLLQSLYVYAAPELHHAPRRWVLGSCEVILLICLAPIERASCCCGPKGC